MAMICGGFTCLSETNCVITGVGIEKNADNKPSGLKITTQKSVINLKEVESKPLNVWTSKPSQNFTCAAIYDASTQKYAACINNKLVIWDDTVPDITKVKPLPIVGTIQGLYSLPGDGRCAILWSNGAVCSTNIGELSDVVTEDKEGLLQPDEVILETHLWTIDGECGYVVCLVEKSKHYSLYFIQVPDVNHTGKQVIQVSLDLPAKCSLHQASFHTTNSLVVMHTVGSDGNLYQLSLSPSELPQHKTLSCKAVLKELYSSRQAKQVKIASMGPSLVAIVGLDGEYADHVCVWDTKYSILQAKQSIKIATDKTKTSVSNIVHASNHLWVSTNHGITGFGVERAPSTLSMALGRQAASDGMSRVPMLGQQWRFDEQGEFEEQMDTSDGTDHDLLQNILNKDKCKTSKQFNTAVYKLLSSKHLATSHTETATILQRVLKHVCERCSEGKKFWPKEGLLEMVKTGLIPASSCPDLIECAIGRDDVDILMSCLQHMQDIPDNTLASIINYVLRDLSSETGESGRSEPPVQCPLAEDSVQIIDLILKCPMNDIFMLECIANIKFHQIMVLLRYLYYRLNTTIADDEQTLPANVVIDWIMLILDAHYSQLVLSSEARVLLVNLHQIVGTLSHYHDEVDAVHEMLRHLPSPITETPKVKLDAAYSIEVLKL